VRFLPRNDRRIAMEGVPPELLASMGLSQDEQRLLGLADGSRTTGQLRAIGRMLQVDVERVLAMTHALQLLKVEEGSGAPAGQPLAGALAPAAGDVARFPPGMLLVTMAYARKTGVLTFESTSQGQAATRTVQLDEGRIAFASSSDPGDRLGQVLIRSSMVTKEQLQSALAAAQATPGMALGRILVAQGVLGPDDLHRALVHQVQQVVTGVLAFRSGTFRFQEQQGPPPDIIPLDLDTRTTLLDAHRTCSFADLASRVPAPGTRARASATPELFADLKLTDLERQLRDQCDGLRRLQEIITSCPAGPEPAMRALLGMMSIGVIEGFLPREAESAPEPPPARAAQPVPASATAAPPRPRVMSADESFGESAPAENASTDASDGELSFGSLGEDSSFGDVAADVAVPVPAAAAPAQAPPLFDLGATAEAPDAAASAWSAPANESPASWSASSSTPAVSRTAPEPASGSSGLFSASDLSALGDELGDFELAEQAQPQARRSAATAVAELPQGWDEERLAHLCNFLALVAEWLRHRPDALPESILATLPRDIRDSFGL
jgi:hypothetical protein